MARASITVAVVLAACGGGAPKPPAKPEPPQPLAIADVQGPWTATDIDGWTYALSIDGETYAQTIGRTTGGPCTQKGTLVPYEKAYGSPYVPPNQGAYGGDPYGGAGYGGAPAAPVVQAFILNLAENTCNPDFAGAQLIVVASDYHGAKITLRTGVGYGGAEESHTYQRVEAPTSAPTSAPKP